MRLTRRFAVLLTVVMALTGSTGAYLVASLSNASAQQAETLQSASDITAACERLQSIATHEVALILGYLRGVTSLDEVSAKRAEFEQELQRIEQLAAHEPEILAEVERARAVENSLFLVPEQYGDGDLPSLLRVARDAKAELLAVNAMHRVRIGGYTGNLADAESQERIRELAADIERERVAILEFEPALQLGESYAEQRMDTVYELNSEIVRALAEQAAADLRQSAAATDDLEDVYPERAQELRLIQRNLTLLAHRVSHLAAITDRGWTENLFKKVETNITKAEELGLPVKRGDVPQVGKNVTLTTTLGKMITHQQRMRSNADIYFNSTLTLAEVMRGSFDSRASALQDSIEVMTQAADADAANAQVRADDALERATWAILATLVLLVATVAGGGALIVRTIRSRLHDFDAAAKSVSAGRFDHAPPVVGSDDFDDLARAWEGMTAALRDREKELAEKNAVLHQSERMAAIGSLVAGVAHEVNNPLFFVRGNEEMTLQDIEMLLERDDVKAVPGLVDTLQAMRESTEVNIEGLTRIENTNRALKGFAGHTQTEREVVDMNGVADGVLILAHNQLKNRFRIAKDFHDLPRVTASPQEIGQVILNLIMNAADASPEGSTITLITEEKDGEVHLTVKDEGPGVPESMREKLFTQFETSKPDGTGLGLYISRSIAEEHGGRLWLSGNDDGAAFTLALPAHDGNGENGSDPSGTATPVPGDRTPDGSIRIPQDSDEEVSQ